MYLLSRKIKALGFKVVMSGEGADEIFGGYLYFHKAPSPAEFHRYTPVTHLLHTCYTPVTHLLLSTDILVYQDHFLSAERLSTFPFLLLHPLLLFVSAHGKLSLWQRCQLILILGVRCFQEPPEL
jgi:hypothetical protein